jgi:hypothetical protein
MSNSGLAVPDRSNGDGPFITVVRPNDVILGRGAPASTYQGNVRFRALISERQEEYSRAERRQIKDKIAREILREIDRRRGRFLRKIESSQEERRLGVPAGVTAWVEADEDVALEKIKQALRHRDQSQSQSEMTTRRRADQAPAAPQAAMLPSGSAAAAAAGALVPRNLAAQASNNDLNVQLFPSLGGLAHMVPPPSVPLLSQPTSTLSQLLSNRLAHFQQEQQLREQQQLAAALLGQQQMLESQHLYRKQVLQAAAVSALAGSSIPMVNPLLSHLTPVASALWNPMAASALSAPARARIATDSGLVGNGVAASITTASNATPSTATNPSGSSSAQSGIDMSDRSHSRAIVPTEPARSNANNVTAITNDTTAVHQSVVEPQEAAAASAPPAHTMAYVRDQATTELMHLQNAISMELLARGVVLPSHNQGIATLQLPEPMNERPSSVSSTGAKSSSCSGSSKSTNSKLVDEEENRKAKAQPPGDGASSAVVQEAAAAAAAPDGNKSSPSSESKTTASSCHADETVHRQNKKRRTSHP